MPAGLVREQVVEVRVANPGGAGFAGFGSGYLITPSLVLTALHVVKESQTADVVFSVRQPDNPLRVPAEVAWSSAACDMALLRVRWPAGILPWPVTPACLGDIPRVAPEIPFEGFGFPRRKQEEVAADRYLRDGDRVPGDILPERNVKTARLDLQLTADPPDGYGAWMGFSGSAVFAHGYLVGVVTDATPNSRHLTARRVAVPAGACWALTPSAEEPPASIARFRALLAEDGHDLRVSPARRRPAYLATVDSLRAAGGLADRAADLGELRAFTHPGSADDDRPYADWVAGAWAGKTALAAELASDPPPGADLVAFFVSRTSRIRVAQASEFWSECCDQLAALLGEQTPEAPGEALFRQLWVRAGQEAERNGRTLILLVDGLDENDQPPPIAGSIPADGDRVRRVIVFRREEPEPDVPDGHPLTDPRRCVRRDLAASARAGELRQDATKTLREFLAGDNASVLGVLAAAGPISARDIAEVRRAEDSSLTKVPELLAAEVDEPVLDKAKRLGLVWPLASDPERFAFQHDTLRELTVEKLKAAVIRVHADTIRRLAADYAARRWPAETPAYLLFGYPAMLAGQGDGASLSALASPDRAARLRAATGNDAATADELGAAIGLLAKDAAHDGASLAAACGLAFRRAQLLDALTRYPEPLIEAHAALGHWERAERIAAHQAWPVARLSGLTMIAVAAAAAGQGRRADELFAAALHTVAALGDRSERDAQRMALAAAAAASARLIPSRSVRDDNPGNGECVNALLAFATAYASARLTDYAEQFMHEACGPEGPVARAAAWATTVAASAPPGVYGAPRSPNAFTDVATRQAAIQEHLNCLDSVRTTVEIVVRAAAAAGRLDTAVRVAAILPDEPTLLAVLGEACRAVTEVLSGPALAEAFGDAREAAAGLPGAVHRVAALSLLANAASGQLARDLTARAAVSGVSLSGPAQRAQVADLVHAGTQAGGPPAELIARSRAGLTAVTDPGQRMTALTILAQAAAAAGEPADELFQAAVDTCAGITDAGPLALPLGVLSQAIAAVAQLEAFRQAAADDGSEAMTRWLAGLRLSAPADGWGIWTVLSATMMDDASRAEALRAQSAAIASGQLSGLRAVTAALTDPDRRGRLRQALGEAALTGSATDLGRIAARLAADRTDPWQRETLLSTLAHRYAACGQLALAREVIPLLAGRPQQAAAWAAAGQAAAAAGRPGDARDLLATARETAVTLTDRTERDWALSAVVQAAVPAGESGLAGEVAAELADPSRLAWALGMTARAMAAAGQPADDLLTRAAYAARTISHPGQRAWALALAARDAAGCARSDLAAGLVGEAEQAALSDEPVLRAALLAALAQASAGQPERAQRLFAQACQAAEVPQPAQRAMALAEIARCAPGRPGWPERIGPPQDAALADPSQRVATLSALVLAANRAGDEDLVMSVGAQFPSLDGKLWSILLMARTAAVRGDAAGAATMCEAAAKVGAKLGLAAPPWAAPAFAATQEFCLWLRQARAAADRRAAGALGAGSQELMKLVQAAGAIASEPAEMLAVADAAHRNNMLDLSTIAARSVPDPVRRAYLLAAIAEADLAAGQPGPAAEALALLPPRAALPDRGVRGRVLEVSVAAAQAAGGAGAARAELAAGLADCFSPEVIRVIAALSPQAVARLAAELGVPPS